MKVCSNQGLKGQSCLVSRQFKASRTGDINENSSPLITGRSCRRLRGRIYSNYTHRSRDHFQLCWLVTLCATMNKTHYTTVLKPCRVTRVIRVWRIFFCTRFDNLATSHKRKFPEPTYYVMVCPALILQCVVFIITCEHGR